MVPIFNTLSYICDLKEWYAVSKCLDTISIFQYQATIYYVQNYQMNVEEGKMLGLNLWFIIEIMSFYGYILAAIIYITAWMLESTYRSYRGVDRKRTDNYKYDFIRVHRD